MHSDKMAFKLEWILYNMYTNKIKRKACLWTYEAVFGPRPRLRKRLKRENLTHSRLISFSHHLCKESCGLLIMMRCVLTRRLCLLWKTHIAWSRDLNTPTSSWLSFSNLVFESSYTLSRVTAVVAGKSISTPDAWPSFDIEITLAGRCDYKDAAINRSGRPDAMDEWVSHTRRTTTEW